jgi:hypothetical protein
MTDASFNRPARQPLALRDGHALRDVVNGPPPVGGWVRWLWSAYLHMAANGGPDYRSLPESERREFEEIVSAGEWPEMVENLKRAAEVEARRAGLYLPAAALAELSAGRVQFGEPLPAADRDRLAGVASQLYGLVVRLEAHRLAAPDQTDAPAGAEVANTGPAAAVSADDRAARKLAAYAALHKYGPNNLAEIARAAGVPRTTLYSWLDFMDFVYQARREIGERKNRFRYRSR